MQNFIAPQGERTTLTKHCPGSTARCALLAALVLVVLAPVARAEKIWTSPLSGFWQDSTNWSTWDGITGMWVPTPAPGPNSFNRITNDVSKTVTIDALTPATNLTVGMLWLSAPPGATNTLLLTDAGTNNPLVFTAGLQTGSGGAIRITNSSLLVQITMSHFDLDGSVTLDSGLFDFSDTTVTARVGRVTSGTLTVNGGTGNAGALTVGSGSTSATGTVNLNGGVLNVAGRLILGHDTGTMGTVAMVGGQLNVLNDDTRVGDVGVGQMTISNSTASLTNLEVGRDALSLGTLVLEPGGVIQALNDVSVARFNGSTGIVSVAGGQLQADGQKIRLGRGGNGQMSLSSGSVQASMLLVAADGTNSTGGTASFSMTGGSLILASNLLVGVPSIASGQVFMNSGTAAVTNADGSGLLSVDSGTFSLTGGDVSVDDLILTNGAGQLAFGSGTLVSRGTVVANGSSFVVGDGVNPATFRLNGGTHSFANNLVISSNATLTGCGTVIGTIVNHGTIATNCSTQVRPNIVAVSRSGTTANVTCTSVSGQVYTLQFKNAFTDPAWTPITPGTSGTGANLKLVDPAATAPTRFYRVSTQ